MKNKSKNTISQINLRLTEREYKQLDLLCSNEIDHCIIHKDDTYSIILHGSSLGYVKYNGQSILFQQLEKYVSQEIEKDNEQHYNYIVCCCYGGYMNNYTSNNKAVSTLFDNKGELLFKGIRNNSYSCFSANFSVA